MRAVLQEPSHILAERAHIFQPFLVVERFALVATVPHIPVGAADDEHAVDEHKAVDRVENGGRPAAPNGDDRGARLASQRPFRPENVPDAVDERLRFGRDVRVISRRREENPVRFPAFLRAFVDYMIDKANEEYFSSEENSIGKSIRKGDSNADEN